MANYRAVVDHVGYWRGTIHKWSTSYEFTGSGTTPNTAACTALATADSNMCYSSVSGGNGGICEVRFYNSSGGVPIVTETFFDYAVPGDWIKYLSGAYASKTVSPEAALETALLVEWPAGLSSTGKPVYFRKWFHAVKQSVNAEGDSSGDMVTADVTSLTTYAETLATCLASGYGLALGNARRLAGTSPQVSIYYSNHQMPKGRRRKTVSSGGTTYRIVGVPTIEGGGEGEGGE